MQRYPLDASLTLAEAGPKWLEQHKRYIRPNTLRNYRACIKLLTAFLGEVIVKDIDIGHIRTYQAERSAKAGHYLINGEVTKLLSDPKVSPQVSKEIAGHISQAMQSHYSIQQHDTKMAALEALEDPAARPEPEPTAPAQRSASGDVIQPAIQAEIDRLRAEIARLAERQVDLVQQERLSTPSLPEKPTRRRRRRKSDSGDPSEVIFHLRRPAKNLISFPTRSA